MAWRIVKQPNGKYARFSDVVDDFTHCDCDREEVVALCIGKGLSPEDAETKVQRADDNPTRFKEELKTIEVIHGGEISKNRELMLSIRLGPKVGDVVTRMLAGTIPMDLHVTEITDDQIICGDWTFDKKTGAEIDDYLDWGPPPKMTGSFIKL